jgi:hypothetical protein
MDIEVFDIEKINIFGILFVFVLLRSCIGIIYYIILVIKYKKCIILQNKVYIFPSIIFSILILFSAIKLLIKGSYNSSYYIGYSLFILSGTYFYINSILYEYELKKPLKLLYSTLVPLYSSLLIMIGYLISIY